MVPEAQTTSVMLCALPGRRYRHKVGVEGAAAIEIGQSVGGSPVHVATIRTEAGPPDSGGG